MVYHFHLLHLLLFCELHFNPLSDTDNLHDFLKEPTKFEL